MPDLTVPYSAYGKLARDVKYWVETARSWEDKFVAADEELYQMKQTLEVAKRDRDLMDEERESLIARLQLCKDGRKADRAWVLQQIQDIQHVCVQAISMAEEARFEAGVAVRKSNDLARQLQEREELPRPQDQYKREIFSSGDISDVFTPADLSNASECEILTATVEQANMIKQNSEEAVKTLDCPAVSDNRANVCTITSKMQHQTNGHDSANETVLGSNMDAESKEVDAGDVKHLSPAFNLRQVNVLPVRAADLSVASKVIVHGRRMQDLAQNLNAYMHCTPCPPSAAVILPIKLKNGTQALPCAEGIEIPQPMWDPNLVSTHTQAHSAPARPAITMNEGALADTATYLPPSKQVRHPKKRDIWLSDDKDGEPSPNSWYARRKVKQNGFRGRIKGVFSNLSPFCPRKDADISTKQPQEETAATREAHTKQIKISKFVKGLFANIPHRPIDPAEFTPATTHPTVGHTPQTNSNVRTLPTVGWIDEVLGNVPLFPLVGPTQTYTTRTPDIYTSFTHTSPSSPIQVQIDPERVVLVQEIFGHMRPMSRIAIEAATKLTSSSQSRDVWFSPKKRLAQPPVKQTETVPRQEREGNWLRDWSIPIPKGGWNGGSVRVPCLEGNVFAGLTLVLPCKGGNGGPDVVAMQKRDAAHLKTTPPSSEGDEDKGSSHVGKEQKGNCVDNTRVQELLARVWAHDEIIKTLREEQTQLQQEIKVLRDLEAEVNKSVMDELRKARGIYAISPYVSHGFISGNCQSKISLKVV
ncbi:hypothetical protein K470DRAFT_272807 [Piedraia hortae CBS 480.64]|uniref:Uncharacterized protein n=1 Tax=Piedraia hortae CBS 480.64 TaxID=1314780 RepID=A0A6A7BTG9_9PEZI|nr:hypothetical protein K470DRAFT_272807 [Piedraia hortae CBS 480.64]